jgi:hypothetical protein
MAHASGLAARDAGSAMPRYFFDLRSPLGVTQDHQGAELPDLDCARMEAIELSKRLVREGRAGSANPADIVITDEGGLVLDTVKLEPPT